MYIVAALEGKEMDFLKKMDGKDNYFFFSAFIRGFTQENLARQEFKAINKNNKGKSVLFTVNFPQDYSKLSKEENNGFVVCENADE